MGWFLALWWGWTSTPVNASPQPPTDLTQLLLGVLGQNADSDITQAVVTDYQDPSTETITSSDSQSATTITAPYHYDDSGHSLWGLAQYA